MEKDHEELRDRSDDLAYQHVKKELVTLLLQLQSDLNDPLEKIDFSSY